MRKTEALLRDLSKRTFSLNSRNRVRLSDVKLIVKDLLRKQELLKKPTASRIRSRMQIALEAARSYS